MIAICLHRVVPEILPEMRPYRLRGTVITTKELDRLMQRLSESLTPLPVDTALSALGNQDLKRGFCLTFDDGYSDNLEYAAPILKKWGINALIFPVSGLLDRSMEILPVDSWYWLFVSAAKHRFSLNLRGYSTEFNLQHPGSWTQVVHGRLKELFLRLPWPERKAKIREFSQVSQPRISQEEFANGLYLDQEQIKGLVNEYGWRIGSHGRTHAFLDTLDPNDLCREIEGSVGFLENFPGFRPVFAYPDARISQDIQPCLNRAGIRFAFVLGNRPVTVSDPEFALPRYTCQP